MLRSGTSGTSSRPVAWCHLVMHDSQDRLAEQEFADWQQARVTSPYLSVLDDPFGDLEFDDPFGDREPRRNPTP